MKVRSRRLYLLRNRAGWGVCFLWMLFCSEGMSFAQAPVFRRVTPNWSVVDQYESFELNIDLRAVYSNPYDYGDITVSCLFISPGGRKDTVDGFFMQDYTLNTDNGSLVAKGTGSFRVRYAPREAGRWQYRLYCATRTGSTMGKMESFRCEASTLPGFIRRNETPYLSFDNGAQYIPIGENIGWAHANAYMDYSKWVGKLAANKGNFIRVWMPSWGLGLEWQNGRNGYSGLQSYKQENAWYLDWLVGFCREKGVYMMLTLDHHGQVSSKVDPNWNENPYNAANGGPCVHTWDFFTDSTARQLIRNRFRYIVARYGYSSHIMCWELFNEVEWTDDFARHKSEITAWHKEMAAWLRSKDVNKHLITTSYASAIHDPATWNLPDIDFTQTHYYVGVPNLDSVLSSACQSYFALYGKPTLTGEFGLSGDAGNLAATDPHGIYIHNSLWGTLLGGGMGAGLPWYWDNYIEPQNLYTHFLALADFASGISFSRDHYTVAPVRISGDGGGLGAAVLKSSDHSRMAGWVLNKQYNWKNVKENGTPAAVAGASIILPGVKDGTYRVRWSDCRTGALVLETTVTVTGQELRLACPTVAWDLSVVVEAVL
ncbi:MAG TPA: DUF5060 domain-containing protein [Puia sp.]